MLKAVHCIIHPFFGFNPAPLMPYYKALTKKVMADKNLHLAVFTCSAHTITHSFKVEKPRDHASEGELLENKLLNHICSVFEKDRDKVSLLVSNNPSSPYEITTDLMQATQHPWFAEMAAKNGPESYITLDYRRVFHRWRSDICSPLEYGSSFMPEHVKINGEDFITFPIPIELGKIYKRLSPGQTTVSVNNIQQNLYSNFGLTNHVMFIGHGVYLKGCVLSNITGIALSLGFPLTKIEISPEQYENTQGLEQREIEKIPLSLRFPFQRKLDRIGDQLMFGWNWATR